MKTCSKCGVAKESSEFFVKDSKTGRLHAQCKTCYSAHRKTYYKQHYEKYHAAYLERAKVRRSTLRDEFRQNMLRYLSDKYCAECGESDIRVLEFAHMHPDEKLFSISQAVRLGYSWDDILLEMKKCRILCANCHKKETAEQFGWYKL
jgi:5-methylcytosine-specific restriction endonuclease McrA